MVRRDGWLGSRKPRGLESRSCTGSFDAVRGEEVISDPIIEKKMTICGAMKTRPSSVPDQAVCQMTISTRSSSVPDQAVCQMTISWR